MSLDVFLSEYSGHIIGAFALGFGGALLFTYAKKYFEQI